MNCPRCNQAMTVQVIPTAVDGDLNILTCKPCNYTKPIPQARPFEVLQFRARVSQMLEAA